MVMVSMWVILNCSSEVPVAPERAPVTTESNTETIYPNSDNSKLAPIVTFTNGKPGDDNAEQFTITIIGNQNTDSYQWVVVNDGASNCATATYKEATPFPDNKQSTFDVTSTDIGDAGPKTLCATGSNKDTTSEPVTHSWTQQAPPATEQPAPEVPVTPKPATTEQPTTEQPTTEQPTTPEVPVIPKPVTTSRPTPSQVPMTTPTAS